MKDERKINFIGGILLLLIALFQIIHCFEIWNKASIVCVMLFCPLFFIKYLKLKKESEKEAKGSLFLSFVFLLLFIFLLVR